MKSIAAVITSGCLHADGLWLAERSKSISASKSMSPALDSDHVTSSFLQVAYKTAGGVSLDVTVRGGENGDTIRYTKGAYLNWEFQKIVDIHLAFIKVWIEGASKKEPSLVKDKQLVDESAFKTEKEGLGIADCPTDASQFAPLEVAAGDLAAAQAAANTVAEKFDELEEVKNLKDTVGNLIQLTTGQKLCFKPKESLPDGKKRPEVTVVVKEPLGDEQDHKVSLFASILLERDLEERVPGDLAIAAVAEDIIVDFPTKDDTETKEKIKLELAGEKFDRLDTEKKNKKEICNKHRPTAIDPVEGGEYKTEINAAVTTAKFIHLMFPCPGDQEEDKPAGGEATGADTNGGPPKPAGGGVADKTWKLTNGNVFLAPLETEKDAEGTQEGKDAVGKFIDKVNSAMSTGVKQAEKKELTQELTDRFSDLDTPLDPPKWEEVTA